MFKLSKLFSLVAFLVFALFSQNAMAEVEEYFGIGAELTKDTYSKKLIVTGVFDNSPAKEANLAVGSEITRIDGQSVRKMPLCEITAKIRGDENTVVKLTIKKNFFKREIFELTRKKITLDIYRHKLFDPHWAQIAPPCYQDVKLMPEEAVKKFSRKYKKNVLAVQEYWYKRKEVFKTGYNMCVNYSSKNNQELCLIHLMDREYAKTNTDKTLYKLLRD
ncbi:MAG: PDZ domain-containing protein [Candidatus Gastranaerophilales bacterium]|nr:PDZ domain-containing protein [Candidatus Gastranaerophilales bacterium]